MPLITLDILPFGPVIDILVGVTKPRAEMLKKDGKTEPQPVQVRGLVDTGASCTAIDPDVLKQLGLDPKGTTQIQTPSTGKLPHTCNQYDVSLYLPHPSVVFRIPALPVIESCLSNQGIGALIGRDVLANCFLFYNGAVNRFALAF